MRILILLVVAAVAEAQIPEKFTNLQVLPKDIARPELTNIMELNAETNTLTGWGNSLLAMAHKANGETEKAIADFTKIVATNPNDGWAKGQLDELKSKKN